MKFSKAFEIMEVAEVKGVDITFFAKSNDDEWGYPHREEWSATMNVLPCFLVKFDVHTLTLDEYGANMTIFLDSDQYYKYWDAIVDLA